VLLIDTEISDLGWSSTAVMHFIHCCVVRSLRPGPEMQKWNIDQRSKGFNPGNWTRYGKADL